MTVGEYLFYGGLAGMGLAVLAGLAAFFVLRRSGKRLRQKLDREYGVRGD